MAKSYSNRWELFDAALSSVRVTGLFCEFGVFTGESISYIASKVQVEVHGFDSFDGLPEDWRPSFEAGRFRLDRYPRVASNVVLHPGWFHDSLPAFLSENAGPVAFLHIDCDLHSSTTTVLLGLADRIVPGTVIQFDEFFNYPGWHSGEYAAFEAFCRDRNVQLDYLGYVSDGEQFAVRIADISESATAVDSVAKTHQRSGTVTAS